MSLKEVCSALVLGIRDYFYKNRFRKAVIGLSGGVDSSVAACLVAKALGNKNMTALLMPDLGITSKQSMEDAMKVAEKLRVSHYTIPINNFAKYFQGINKDLKLRNDIYAIANLKARMRMVTLYYFANISNALVVGTSDKSEIALGYATKYGDNAADILVIGDLWKSDVIEMGRFLGLPHSILRKKPTAELIAGQTAEKELGAPYSILDKILKMRIEGGLSAQQIINKGFGKRIVKNVIDRVKLNEHKRRSPVLLRISERSFHSMEWRMPITNRFGG